MLFDLTICEIIFELIFQIILGGKLIYYIKKNLQFLYFELILQGLFGDNFQFFKVITCKGILCMQVKQLSSS